MEFLVQKLNYLAFELDKKYNINSGGCCYFAYLISKWLEAYNIKFYFIIQDDGPIRGNSGKHYCLQLLPSKMYINKLSKYSHIKTMQLTSKQIYSYYKKSNWSEKYNADNNSFVKKGVDNIFSVNDNKRSRKKL